MTNTLATCTTCSGPRVKGRPCAVCVAICPTCSGPRTSGRTCQVCKPAKRMDTSEVVAMMQRMIRALEARAVDDPSVLAEVILLSQQLSEVTNVVIATSATRYSLDAFSAPSAGEIGRSLGMSKQAVSERRKIGDRVIMERALGEGTMPQRERAARTRARNHAETTMGAWLSRRSQDA